MNNTSIENSGEILPPVKVVEWVGDAKSGFLKLLDQTRLPEERAFVECRDLETLWKAIQRLVVRGAPAIGVAAGYGMVIAAQSFQTEEDFLQAALSDGEYLKSSRPTAVNLEWAVELICNRLEAENPKDLGALQELVLDKARRIHEEDQRMCLAMGRYAAELIKKCSGVLTHCNAGALATAGIGTATAGMYVAKSMGHDFVVYCDETRPLLQGSRLTAWELMQAEIDAVVITDSMAAQVMREHRVQMVITGADRIAANGDAANKIGTYGLAILAERHKIPFYVAAPYSTFDLNITSGQDIPIEQRSSEEITCGFGKITAPIDAKTYSPAFDITPAELITAIITDRGIIQPVNLKNVRKIVSDS